MEMPHATASNPKMMYKNSGGVFYIRVSHVGYRETTPIAQPEAGSNWPDYECTINSQWITDILHNLKEGGVFFELKDVCGSVTLQKNREPPRA